MCDLPILFKRSFVVFKIPEKEIIYEKYHTKKSHVRAKTIKQVVALKSSNSIDGKSGKTNLECKRHHLSSYSLNSSSVDFHRSFLSYFNHKNKLISQTNRHNIWYARIPVTLAPSV